MSTFFTSDLHLGHVRINELAGRPFADVDEMNTMLIENWNAHVGPNDTVMILGDMCMGKIVDSLALIGNLNGLKCLVPGNHDRPHSSYDKRDWKRIEWRQTYVEAGLILLNEQFVWELGPFNVNVCHFPYSGDHTDEDRYSDHRPIDDGKWLLHGHVHEAWKVNGRQINVGVDVWGFAPVHSDTLIELIKEG